MQKPLLIACAGHATVGKDFFCNLLAKELSKKDFYVRRYALAHQLKADLCFLIRQNFGFDIYDCTIEQKTLVRPILVEYGRAKRVQSKGTFWTNLVEEQIRKDKPDIAILSDLRYDIYPKDERFWAQNKMGGVLVYLDRDEEKKIPLFDYRIGDTEPTPNGKYNIEREYVKAPNIDEETNNPKLRVAADYRIEVKTVSKDKIEQEWQPHVEKFLQYLKENGRI